MEPRRPYKPLSSPQQLFLFGKIRSVYPEARLEHPILTSKTIRYADIAIIINGLNKKQTRLDIEYDGEKEHKNRKKQDKERDVELRKAGWITLRLNKYNKDRVFELIEEKINDA